MSEEMSPRLKACLRDVWWRRQKFHFVAGCLAFLRWSIGLFLLGMFIDWMTFMPVGGRVVITIAIIVVPILMGTRKGWIHLASFNARDMALKVEESLGGCKSLLVTATQIGHDDWPKGVSQDMLNHTLKKAEELSESVNKNQVIPFVPLGKPALWALGFLVVIGVFSLVGGSFIKAGVVRLSPPWLSVKYPTRTQVNLITTNLILKEGSESLIEAEISGVIPDSAEIVLRTGSGKARTREIVISEGMCQYEISSAYRDFEYRIMAGDDRSEWRKVQVIPSPKISKADVKVVYPEYTLKKPETLDALTLSLPEGSQVEWNVTLDRAVSSAYVVEGNGEPRELQIDADGTLITMAMEAKSSSSYKFKLVEKGQGFTFFSPNNYLQVQPDQAPQVEITQPEKNMIATLGRKVELAYRARDDHGIGEARVCYRVNKIAEKKADIPVPTPEEQGEKLVDWDYRETLKNLEVGDTVSFVIEMADRYPGEEGPHLVRSQNRRLTILSERDYISQMAKQRNRLLRKIKNIYREERDVHVLIAQLQPESENFVQSCQLEVVRQELIRERLVEIKVQMGELEADLRANGFTEEKYTSTLMRLQSELDRIANEYISSVSNELRALTSAKSSSPSILIPAVDAVNFAAREMALMVLSLGFREATEIMAREIDTIASDQAHLRMNTVLLASGGSELPKDALQSRQKQLAEWLSRLLGEIPKDKESRSDEAIIAFKLSRLSKDLKKASTESNMLMAAKNLGTGEGEKAAALQAEIIKSLLKAEFRLRSGLEYGSLVKAEKVLRNQVSQHTALRNSISGLSPQEFMSQKDEFEKTQLKVARELALLLLPEIPGGSYELFDVKPPVKPDISTHLAKLEKAIASCSSNMSKGDQKLSLRSLKDAGQGFQELANLVRIRINELKESDRVSAMSSQLSSRIKKITDLEERLLGILEKTEDAESDETDGVYLAPQLDILGKDTLRLVTQIKREADAMGNDESAPPLMKTLKRISSILSTSAVSLREKRILDSIDQQSSILDNIEGMVDYITRAALVIGQYGSARSLADTASAPGPLLSEIIGEQHDLVKAAENTKEEDLPTLAIPQKNLIHAVNAILTSLDPLSHQIETGSVLLFAKEDMNSASEALEEKDLEEAIDAGSFVAESMGGILEQLEYFSPQYIYIREVTAFLNQRLSRIQRRHYELTQIVWALENREGDDGLAKLSKLLPDITVSLQEDSEEMSRLREKPQLEAVGKLLSSARKVLASGDGDSAMDELEKAQGTLEKLIEEGVILQELLPLMLAPPVSPIIPPEVIMVKDFLALATQQKEILRDSFSSKMAKPSELEGRQVKLEGLITKFIDRYTKEEENFLIKKKSTLTKTYSRMRKGSVKVPLTEAWASEEKGHKAFFAQEKQTLASIQKHMKSGLKELKKGNVKGAQPQFTKSKNLCRSFLIDNTLKFMVVPGPPPPADPAPSFDISEEDSLLMEAAGMVRGRSIKGGRLEWEVLGRRDRAALNENFARELPLEYRGLLKDYYERLAQ